jgi:hypothetical protein
MSGEFNKLIQNIDKLEKTSFESGLHIEKFMLPDKQAVKKYIAMLNPQMSRDDIDLMVDGADELYKKLEEKFENKRKSDSEENLSESSKDTNENTNTSGASGDGTSNTNTSGSPQTSGGSGNQQTQQTTTPAKFEYTSFYQQTPDGEVTLVRIYFKGKKVREERLPRSLGMEGAEALLKEKGKNEGHLDENGNLIREEPDLPAQQTTPQSGDATSSNTTTPANPSDEKEKRRQEREQRKKEEREIRKRQIKEFVDLAKEIYEEQVNEIKKKVKEIKKEIQTAFFILKAKLQELVSKLINSLISAAVAIPAAVLKITLPPFNVPDALKGVLVLVQCLLDLIAVVKDLIPFLKPIKYLTLVTSAENLAILGTIMNPIIEGIFAILAPIQGFENIIFTLLNLLLSLLANTKESTFRKATKKLKKLGHLKKLDLPIPEEAINLITKVFWGTDNRGKKYENDGDPPNNDGEKLKLQDETPVTVYSFSPDDITEIIGLLDTFVVKNNRVVAYRQKIKFKDQDTEPEDLIKTLIKELENSALPAVPKDTSEFEQFVYDIKLPDGTTIFGISEEAVEFYKNKYTLTFKGEV